MPRGNNNFIRSAFWLGAGRAALLCFWLALAASQAPGGEPRPAESTNLFLQARARMVRDFRTRHQLTNAAVLKALERVPRHEFVPAEWRQLSYVDSPLPIGYDQT